MVFYILLFQLVLVYIKLNGNVESDFDYQECKKYNQSEINNEIIII